MLPIWLLIMLVNCSSSPAHFGLFIHSCSPKYWNLQYHLSFIQCANSKQLPSAIGSMGCMVYLPTFTIKKSTIHLGKYTSSSDFSWAFEVTSWLRWLDSVTCGCMEKLTRLHTTFDRSWCRLSCHWLVWQNTLDLSNLDGFSWTTWFFRVDVLKMLPS